MKTKQILIGAALLGGAFWLYSRNKAKGTSETNSSELEKSQNGEGSDDEIEDTQDGQVIQTKEGIKPIKGSAIKLGKPNSIGAIKGVPRPSKAPKTIKEEDAIMDYAYENAKNQIAQTGRRGGLLRFKSRIRNSVFDSVKNQIPNFRSAWIRLQKRQGQIVAMKQTNASSDENASFAFNGHSF